LRKKDKQKRESYKELVVIPGLGIVEKRASSGSGFFSEAVTTGLKLNTIDGMDFHEYMTVYCDNLQASYYDGASNKPSADYSDLVPETDAAPASYGGDPCAPSTVIGIHVVQKGETLYGIARRYGISLAGLRSWNGLTGTDVISICQQLKVKEATAATPSTETPATGTTGTTTFPTTSQPAAGTGSYWMNAPDVHVVRPGETVAMLANMYGYTEARFRKMNSLGNFEKIYSGQKLHSNDCVCPTLESTTASQPLPYGTQPAAKEATAKEAGSDVLFRPIKVHTVKSNETLFSIAKLYNTTPERIIELNGLQKGEDIKLNQRLYVQ
jgi:LysM repeat protein